MSRPGKPRPWRRAHRRKPVHPKPAAGAVAQAQALRRPSLGALDPTHAVWGLKAQAAPRA